MALNHVVACQRILQRHASAEPLDVVWQRFVTWCAEVLPDHFSQEEELLLPHLEEEPRMGHATRLEADHARLRGEFARMRTQAPDAQVLWNVAEDLRLHIRWEEEHLFEDLQGWLDDGALEDLGQRSEAFRRAQGLPVGRA